MNKPICNITKLLDNSFECYIEFGDNIIYWSENDLNTAIDNIKTLVKIVNKTELTLEEIVLQKQYWDTPTSTRLRAWKP